MKLTLGKKIVLLVILIAVLLSCTGVIVSGVVFTRVMEREYIITSDSMAATVAQMMDGDQMKRVADRVMEIYRKADNKMDNTRWDEEGFEEYAAQYLDIMEDPDYLAVQTQMRKIQDVSEVDCVYSLCIVPEDKTAVYIVDAAYDEELVTPGLFDLVEPSCYQYLDTPEVGFPAFLSNTEEYGRMVTSCVPVYTSDGEIACYAAVDLSMQDVLEKVHEFLLVLSALLVTLTVVTCLIAIIYVRSRIVKPINMLSEAAGQYGQRQGGVRQKEFSGLDIRTGDELEILLHSMVQMESDIDNYIDNLTRTREQLSNARQHADDMQKQAYLDSLTGIRNRMAYDKEMERLEAEMHIGLKRFGIAMVDLNFLKYTNDTFGHECGNSAIIALSRMICEVFVHSPVFRIGGDEFAVVLRNRDFNRIGELEEEFNSRLEALREDGSLQNWERISAAFGYALYDPAVDTCADDVFKRADQNMYERKKAMKAVRE